MWLPVNYFLGCGCSSFDAQHATDYFSEVIPMRSSRIASSCKHSFLTQGPSRINEMAYRTHAAGKKACLYGLFNYIVDTCGLPVYLQRKCHVWHAKENDCLASSNYNLAGLMLFSFVVST